MRIQFICYNPDNVFIVADDSRHFLSVNSIHDAQSLDDFDINVISLQDKELWKNKGLDTRSIDSIKDLKSLGSSILESNRSKMLILYPQNYAFKYCFNGQEFFQTEEIKNVINNIQDNVFSVLCPQMKTLSIIYENVQVRCGNNMFSASFVFCGKCDSLLDSTSSKCVAVKNNNIYFSTVEIKENEDLFSLLNGLHLVEEKELIPEWMNRQQWFDDKELQLIIAERKQEIEKAKSAINEASSKLEVNNRYKSILYSNSAELVEVVFEILEELFDINLSGFRDIKKDDFHFEKNGKTFIGEIKGVSSNIKNDHVSQVERHCQLYMDDIDDYDESKIVGVLIINHQRNVPLEERQPVNQEQIHLAEKYGRLIIETKTLLKMYEEYCNKLIDKDTCIKIISEHTGLLNYDCFVSRE